MDAMEAREILKPFEAYEVLPFTWLDKDLYGNPSAMSVAEAKGYLEALNGPEVAAKDAAYAALDQASRALVAALRKLSKETCPTRFHDKGEVCACFPEVAKEALAQIEEARNGYAQ